jgi:tRNA threonylcarbamoyladenosine biosynthesis protein TsaB
MNTPSYDAHQSIKILAFDTSGDEASLALWVAGKMQCAVLPFGTGPHSQAACLFPMMQDLLESENLNFQDVNVIATLTGPGSFTGIRLGLAAAQGLILSLKARSFAPTTFELFAFSAWKESCGPTFDCSSARPCLVTLTTKRDSFYTQAFEKGYVPLGPASIQTEDDIQDFLALNPAMNRISHLSTSSAENLIHFYFHKLKSNPKPFSQGQEALRPYYLHNPNFVKQKLWSL